MSLRKALRTLRIPIPTKFKRRQSRTPPVNFDGVLDAAPHVVQPFCTMPPDIPQEIVDAILTHIPSIDLDTLHACALVSSAFHAPSRRRLFHSLRLFRLRSLQHPTLGAAARLFESSPELAVHIRDLTIELSSEDEDCKALETILPLIASAGLLGRLVIAGKAARWVDIRKTAPALPDALLAVIRIPSLQKLHIMNLYGLPLEVLVAALEVPVVSFSQAVCVKKLAFPAAGRDPESDWRLRHLALADSVVGGALGVFECLVRAPSVPLTRLDLRLTPLNAHYEERLFVACSGTLEELVLDTAELSDPATYPVPPLPHLRRLSLKLFIGHARSLPAPFLSTLAHFTAPAAVPALHTLTLRFPHSPCSRIRCLLVLRDPPSGVGPRDDVDVWEKFAVAAEGIFPFATVATGQEEQEEGDDAGALSVLRCELAGPQGFYIDRLP
ncbi:hypothetical protein MKEN_00463700 [Mycena kentingensis (nom. inval.)]|nr:hypothetical protein MKEN_00463700 [Mycena kentingensis (nom. inval.)]